ncbi:hypothetical protein BU15DRAFT_67423 [Melanogaster broomeanus]|nr:hypothetical protein BU15DRAFT_67423 [Melanogaster broomeanus]
MHADPSDAVAGPSSFHAESSGPPSKAGPSTPRAGPSTPPKPAPEGRPFSFIRFNAGSDDSWDDLDGRVKCLDYFVGGPRSGRERFRSWRKRSPAVIRAEEQQKEDKGMVRHPTKKAATQESHASPNEATFEHLGDSWVGGAAPRRDTLPLQEQNEQLHRRLDDEAAASRRRMAEGEKDGLKEELKEVQDRRPPSCEPLECQTHPVVEAGPSSSTSNAAKDHRLHPPYHHDSPRAHAEASHASLHINEATSERIREGRVDGANTLVGTLQRQEHTEEIHPRLDDEAARKQLDGKVDWLEEFKELRDIISLTSREPLER